MPHIISSFNLVTLVKLEVILYTFSGFLAEKNLKLKISLLLKLWTVMEDFEEENPKTMCVY